MAPSKKHNSGKGVNKASAQGARKIPVQSALRPSPSNAPSLGAAYNAEVIRDAVPVSFRRPAPEAGTSGGGASSSSAARVYSQQGLPPEVTTGETSLEILREASKTSHLANEDLEEVQRFYYISEIPTFLPEETGTDSFVSSSPYWSVSLEMLRMGMRLPATHFVNDFLSRINRAPGQILPWGWFCLTAFQVACIRAEIFPSFELFLFMFGVCFKGALVQIFPFEERNFISGDPIRGSISRHLEAWFLVGSGSFDKKVPQDFVISGNAPRGDDFPCDINEYIRLRSCFPERVEKGVFLDEGLLAKAYVSPSPYPEGLMGKLFLNHHLPSLLSLSSFNKMFGFRRGSVPAGMPY